MKQNLTKASDEDCGKTNHHQFQDQQVNSEGSVSVITAFEIARENSSERRHNDSVDIGDVSALDAQGNANASARKLAKITTAGWEPRGSQVRWNIQSCTGQAKVNKKLNQQN